MTDTTGRRLLIVGTGLMGASLGLAARAAGDQVWLDDADPERLRLAVATGAGQPVADLTGTVDLAVAGVPPAAVGEVVARLHQSGIAATITHLASVQTQPQHDIEARVPSKRIVGGHPIAGRERSGPHHASADLFRERPWVVCPGPLSAPDAIAAVEQLALACGATVTRMSAAEHDALLARLSHVPQLLSSVLAATVLGLGSGQAALAGAGLRDTTRLADSSPELWGQIVSSNAAPVAAALRQVADPLTDLLTALEQDPARAAEAVRQVIAAGRDGRRLLAGKHGEPAVRWATVTVMVPDQPGALARLLTDAAAGDVNVEDIRVDHSPGHPVGLIELDVKPGRQDDLQRTLTDRGWAASASVGAPD